MLRSLLIKFAMLAVTVALVLWLGWPVPKEESDRAVSSQPAPVQPVVASPQAPADQKFSRPEKRLNVNRATVEELQTLPGIDTVLAQRVVERRKSHGPFKTIEELRHVRGIGDKKLERLRPLVTVKS